MRQGLIALKGKEREKEAGTEGLGSQAAMHNVEASQGNGQERAKVGLWSDWKCVT